MTDSILNNLYWLEGQWEGIHNDGIYHEEWKITDEDELKGRAYLIKKGEITSNEILKIHADGKSVFYTADVKHNPRPVSFVLTYSGNNKFVFENPAHDFPQKITYVCNGNGTLTATVEAVNKDRLRKIEYNLKKII